MNMDDNFVVTEHLHILGIKLPKWLFILGPLVSHECIHLFLDMFYCLSDKEYLFML